ncbi:hypothetical protein [Pseudomonas sp. NBRC 111119]|uniref:hypothetical protein n=1 Tax=Pseudomonas sp. NBRC 111119 TaxID=1661034 RepID=UPI00076209F6|nr:hypothetical protein [Pseudomonas sp. NBRC 111119]
MLEKAGLTFESEVNAALSIELALKSLLATPVENDSAGTVLQQYKARLRSVRGGHNLLDLYHLVPTDVASVFSLSQLEDLFTQKQNTFISLRYIYEEGAPSGSSSLLLDAARWLIPQVIVYFADRGDPDPWVRYMRADPDRMRIA